MLRERLPLLGKRLPLVRVVLFGSWSTGRHTPASDVDLLVIYRGEQREDASSVVKTPEVSRLLMRLLDAREPTVRLTALHWLAARLDVQETALLKGLQDPNGDMQTVAIQILAIRGVQGPAAKELRQALAANDQATLRRLVRSVTPKPAPGR